ncbi:MAG TPA: HEAT repeat domain-containing protein [Terriglobales bacterium]|nr:HEAT repeat domain-containing protein [Terriglobales bacterium]
MFRIEIVAQFLAWWIGATVCLTFALQAFLIFRRMSRERYFARKDAARLRFAEPVATFLAGRSELVKVMQQLGPITDDAERDALAELAAKHTGPLAASRRSRLLWRTGHVQIWAQKAFGARCARQLTDAAFGRNLGAPIPRHFSTNQGLRAFWGRRIFSVPRALALHDLGQLAPEHANVFMAHALHDPAVVVRRLAVESMGENRSLEAIPLLLEELRSAVEEGNDVSLRTIKSALVRYNVSDMESFLPYFTHPTQRMRFFVMDTLREICHRTSNGRLLGEDAFSPGMRRVVLEDCCRDDFADVRARSAGVLRHFLDAEAVRALHGLLQDENEYVRLHAVRACTDPFYRPLIPDLLLRVTDVRWRVREAAVQSLVTLAPQGLEELYHFFVSTRDKYACEQIAEELECRGLIQSLVQTLASGARAELALAVCRKLLQLGFTSMLISELSILTRADLQISFTEALRMAPEEEFMAVLHEIVDPHPQAEHEGASRLLYRPAALTMPAVQTGRTI